MEGGSCAVWRKNLKLFNTSLLKTALGDLTEVGEKWPFGLPVTLGGEFGLIE